MILLYKGTGLIAQGIRRQTRGNYAHAAWMFSDGSVVESHIKCGVVHVANPWVNNEDDPDVFTMRCLTGSQIVRIQNFLLRRVGSGYDLLGVIRFLSGVNRNNMERWFCSELVAEACEMADRPLLKTDAWRISPSTLAWSTELVPLRARADRAWWNERFGK